MFLSQERDLDIPKQGAINKKEKKRKLKPETVQPLPPAPEPAAEWKKMKKDPLKVKSMSYRCTAYSSVKHSEKI